MLHTTGRLAKAAGACRKDYAKVRKALGGSKAYGIDTPVALDRIVKIAGLDATLWALRCVLPGEETDCRKLARLFACECAERVLPIFERDRPDDRRPREAIEVAQRFANGEASDEERTAAASAADASAAAAWAAAARAAAARAAAAWAAAAWAADARAAAAWAADASAAATSAAAARAAAARAAAAWAADARAADARAAAAWAADASAAATSAAAARAAERQAQTEIFLRLLSEHQSQSSVLATSKIGGAS